MKATHLKYRHSEFRKLTSDEQCMFFQCGIILNELRFYDLRLLRYIRFLQSHPKPHEMEIGLIFSETTLLLSEMAAKLHETFNVIKKGYFATKLAKEYHSRLSPQARESLEALKRYHNRADNLIRKIRNGFASHYDRELIQGFVNDLPEDWIHSAFLTGCANDAFLEFGQVVSMHALYKSTGQLNAVAGFFSVCDEVSSTVLRDTILFLHGFLEAASKGLIADSEQIEFEPTASAPVLFMATDG